jgi:hypothetical protein
MFTLKNVGTCYTAIGNSETARKYFKECQDIVNNLKYDCEKPDLRVKDK